MLRALLLGVMALVLAGTVAPEISDARPRGAEARRSTKKPTKKKAKAKARPKTAIAKKQAKRGKPTPSVTAKKKPKHERPREPRRPMP